ncbi:extracellular solute-binding protein [Paenibacillus sp. GCM10027626]|uniref:extracellular solute-binding protein n=1 Tax=Paenibacillus sp. GCM10027626 TaxID=3273411 RepID=UPI00363895D0
MRKKRLSFLFLAIAMIAAACSSNGGKDTSSNPLEGASGSAPPTSSASEEGPAIDPLAKYETPIQITTVRATNDTFKFIPGESLEDNIIYDLYEKDMGIVWKNKWSVSGDNSKYVEKLNLSIASKDLPDVFMVDAGQLKELVDGGLIEDMTEYFDKYATDQVKQAFGYADGLGLHMGSLDGKLYGLPNTRDAAGNLNLLWVRQDWLDNLGLKAPTTIEEVIAVAEAFAKQDPDGNKKNDTYGIMASFLMFDGYGLGSLDALAAAYGAYPGKWIEKDGKLVYGSVQPETKLALEVGRNLYAMGALDKEFAIKGGGETTADVVAGKIGMYYAPFWTPAWPLNQLMEKEPNAKWTALLAPPGPAGEMKVPAGHFTMNWMVVRKGFEHPEALVKAINYWYDLSMPGGSRIEQYSDLRNGKYKDVDTNNYSPVYSESPNKNEEFAIKFNKALQNGDTSELDAAGKKTYEKVKAGGIEGWIEEEIWTKAAPLISQYQGILTDAFYGAPTETMSLTKAALDKLTNETFTKIIMGDKPLDEFDSYVEQWHKIGGEQITAEVNEWAASK